ncbi:hypothetical protein PR001_g3701 [Phytophthora rubi]|uniref:START domain-containing protein n=1 Tax=Phytophthora rubi TaxID=129364 RepID=A0A6A3P052_9STRA|nr:hypothetical protein PR001_g3701 [Phytophthora rubi]
MPKDRFVNANPYEELKVSDEERLQLIDLVDGFVTEHFHKYEAFVNVDKHKVDEQHWKLVKSKDNQHVYAERSGKNKASTDGATDIPVVLSVGTLVGDVDDVMFGVVNPTLDVMRVKASYVHDIDSAAVLCSVVEPSAEEPFRSLIIEWMTIDVPLQSTNLVKSRDFVYIEATGIVHFANGDRLEHNVIDVYASGTVVPGGKIARFLSIQVAAEAMLSATKYVRCGQMKKLSWMMQHRHSAFQLQHQQRSEKCIMCEKKVNSGIITSLLHWSPYGASDSPAKTPANATLKFDVELLAFGPKAKEM